MKLPDRFAILRICFINKEVLAIIGEYNGLAFFLSKSASVGTVAFLREAIQVEGMKVLLVDDETEFLETLVKRLRKRKLIVNGVNSGESALEELKINPVDIVILDVKMPGMSGLEALRCVKREYPLTEVIMLTGHASMEVAIEGMDVGAFDYLMKPIDIDELLYKIQDAYKRKCLNEKTGSERKGAVPE